MTRDWKSFLQESKGLLVAICISFFLHLFLLGQSYLILPNLEDDHYQIAARLVIPAPVKTVADEVKTVKKPESKVKPKPEPIAPVPDAIKPELEAPILPAEPAVSGIPQETPLVAEPNREPQITPQTTLDDPGLIDKPSPYKFVETDFDVRTDVNAKIDSSPQGKAKIVYNLTRSGEGYELSSLIQAQGLVALLIPDLLQTSKGYLTDKGLRPIDYLYQFGDKKDKTYSAKFDWETKQLSMHSSKGEKQAALVEGSQDLLSFMYQFMFVPPLQNMQLAITNGKKLDTYDYSFEGEEVIQTKMGEVKTIHLLRTSGDDEKDELWLALDYQYVPVKIRKTEKDNKVYELLATSLKTEKPPI